MESGVCNCICVGVCTVRVSSAESSVSAGHSRARGARARRARKRASVASRKSEERFDKKIIGRFQVRVYSAPLSGSACVQNNLT